MDGIQVFCAWPHIAGGDLKSRDFDSVSSEHELVWVKYDPIVSTEVEPVDSLAETFLEVICRERGVIDAFGFVWDVGHNLIEPS